ncbi:hypothetical protein CFP56_018059 [Quercus suber]|uniref:Uncharacterized protein n=1 Tax=Quercus suber TaxID=58331 RepID=A0AAW0KN17_QUESU
MDYQLHASESYSELDSHQSMAAANAGRINHAEPGPIDNLVLTHQPNHRSEAIWNRQMPPHHEYFGWFNRVTRRFIDRPGAKLTMLVSLVNRLLRHHPVGTEEHTDINDVLTAVHHIDRVQPPIPEAPNEEAASPAGLSTTEGPSTSTAPIGCPFHQPVATPRGLPTPDPSPYTPHPSPRLTIPSSTSHPSPTLTISSPIPHPSPSLTIPSPIPHPSPSLTILSSTPHPSPSLTIPSPTPHPSPSPIIPPPTPQEFLELSPIPSLNLGIGPTPPHMQQEPPSHNTPTGPSSAIDAPLVEPEQTVRLPAMPKGRPKRISKASPCGTGGHKHGHKPGPEASDEGHARPPHLQMPGMAEC